MARIDRRGFLTQAAGLSLGAGIWSTSAFAQQGDIIDNSAAAPVITPATQAAINRGLDYLASRQNDDGSFGAGGYSRNVAVCGLSGMAFMAAGSVPGRGPHGLEVNRCVAYLLQHTQESGFVTVPEAASHGPMYGHGFATLFLAEVYGMSPDTQIREKLAKAVKLIVDTQNSEGGWRYQPQRRDADISVTISQIMALRAARNAGIYVPNETVERCVEYVKRSQNPDGGFMYMMQGGASRFPRSAAGVVALYSAGIYDGPEISRGLDYLMHELPTSDAFNRSTHYFYGHYYAVQAMWHAGGEHWGKWYPAIRGALLNRQKQDGSWFDSICPEYGTAMACIILQMPNNYLPIFQH
jgi:prenyltransferase beta subunit